MNKQARSESSSLGTPSIIIDDECTWPEKLSVVFEENLETLAAYEKERARVDAFAKADVGLRICPPPNPHAGTRARVLDKANDLLANARLIGWHCARLHPHEIISIQSNGLHVSSRELTVCRVRKLVTAGDLSPKVAERLLTENKADESNRRGLVCLIFTRLPLRSEHCVVRFFRSWGGEALYNNHESDPEIGPVLRNIGIPCIAEVAVPVKGITTFSSVGESMMRGFLHRRHVKTGHSPEMEGSVGEPIPGRDVRRILRRDEPEFELLTQCFTWGERL